MKSLLTAIFLFSIALPGISQEPAFPLKNYTTKDYGRDFHPANMSVLQDKRGIIYAANGFKLLEYDGHSWNSFPINKETWILSLAADSSGIIYAGSQNEFGYFIPDSKGNLIYNSISDSLALDDLDFTNVWKVHAFSGGVVFQSEEKLFIYRNAKITAIRPETSFHTSFIVNNNLYVRERGKGLLKWENDTLIKIKGSEIFDTTGIFMMVPFGNGSREILIGTRGKGLWIYDPEGGSNFRKFQVQDDPLLEQSGITGGLLTDNGLFAISTMLHGLILIDSKGKTISVIDRNKGLSDNDVKQIISDKSGNLWLATNNGLSIVEISSPLSVYSEKSGISGSINSVSRYYNVLFAGTNTGLFRQNINPGSATLFDLAFNLSAPVRCLTNAEGLLFVGTDNGLYECSQQSARKISDQISFALYYSPEMKLLFSGSSKGITVFRYDGSFQKTAFLSDINKDIIGISADKADAVDSITIWLGTRNNGVVRVRIKKNMSVKSDYFDAADGLPGGPATPFFYNSGTIFGTSAGLYKFTDETVVRKNLPDSLKNNKDFLKGYFSTLSLEGKNIGMSVTSLVDDPNRLWICSDNRVGFFKKNENPIYSDQEFSGIDVGKINVIYPEADDICWIGTTDGLIRYDGKTKKDYNRDFLCLTRKVILMNNDSSVFRGSFYKHDTGVVPDQPDGSEPVLSFGHNSVRLEFNAPFYEYSDKIRYSYRLNNSKWSQWQTENFQEFTNLKEGNYVFRVKAVNVYGKESSTAIYRFKVLPPWYRSTLAYVFYVLDGIILIWLIVWANSYRLKMENIRLEGIVDERTAEVVRQKGEIENKNTILQQQNNEIEDSIRYARRIQTAVIPPEDLCLELLPASFIFFRPLNIVSGDFYWISRVDDKIIFTAADCTGHGVPGAFMSMLGVAFLNEIVQKDHITRPDTILNLMRNKVIGALQHKGYSGETRDGMDMSLICIDLKNKTLQFAGAYNPLIRIRNTEITEIDGDNMPVGIYEKMDPFSNHEISIEKGDVFYLASDGYKDQFGGPEGKKLKARKFKEMLVEIHNMPMNTQKEVIEKRFEEWKGDLKQVDDVVVAGIMIS